PEFVDLLVTHRPASLRGRALADVMDTDARQPIRLIDSYRAWRASPARMRETPPSLAFAIIGQAQADGRLSPEEESRTLVEMLPSWALTGPLEDAARAAAAPIGAPVRAAVAAVTGAPARALQPTLNGGGRHG